MSEFPPEFERLHELTSELQLNQGSLCEAETAELDEILSGDENAREWFVLSQELHTMLEVENSIRLQLASDLLPDNVVAMPGVDPVAAAAEPKRVLPIRPPQGTTQAKLAFRIASSFAVMIAAIMGIIWIYVTVADFSQLASKENPSGSDKVSFHKEVLPILTDNCFACHGEDESKREAELRLDIAKGGIDRENPVIVPGNARESELIARVASTDPEYVMPPKDSGKEHLSEEQIVILTKWVDQGANYDSKWSNNQHNAKEIARFLALFQN